MKLNGDITIFIGSRGRIRKGLFSAINELYLYYTIFHGRIKRHMEKLYTEVEFEEAKSRDLLFLRCKKCRREFTKTKHYIDQSIKGNVHHTVDYCSQACFNSLKNKSQTVKCSQCEEIFTKQLSQIKKVKSGNHFCSKSCAARYNNLHKKTGTRRSKLEVWLEEELGQLYPRLCIEYNGKEAINSELDIYIPSLHLAFELNGIYHYEPIHGQKKLAQVQNNDSNKFQLCVKHNISLCIVDVSSLSYFKPKNAQKYLDIIVNIIDENIKHKKS
jgi:hypothetical protein